MFKERINMADLERASRIKEIILSNHTYEQIEDKTGIGTRTLVRITSGKTEPKFDDIYKIAKATDTSIEWIADGSVQDVKRKAGEIYEQYVNDDIKDSQAERDHHFIIWNLRSLKNAQLRSLAEIVNALGSQNYSHRKFDREQAISRLSGAKRDDDSK